VAGHDRPTSTSPAPGRIGTYRPDLRFRTLSSAACALAAFTLSACGSSAPTAQRCQDPAFFEENTQGCIGAAKTVVGDTFTDSGDVSGKSAEVAELMLEGPASEPATLPEGLTVQIVSVKASPAESWVAEDIPVHDTMVRLTVRLSAEEAMPVNVDPMGGTGTGSGRLGYGPNWIEANSWAVEEQVAGSQIAPGAPLDLIEEFSMPADGLSELSYAFSPAAGTGSEFMFTDVETLLP
jgi:hypothetical protein